MTQRLLSQPLAWRPPAVNLRVVSRQPPAASRQPLTSTPQLLASSRQLLASSASRQWSASSRQPPASSLQLSAVTLQPPAFSLQSSASSFWQPSGDPGRVSPLTGRSDTGRRAVSGPSDGLRRPPCPRTPGPHTPGTDGVTGQPALRRLRVSLNRNQAARRRIGFIGVVIGFSGCSWPL